MPNLSANDQFLIQALERNYAMQNYNITAAGQVMDIQLDSVPGWADSIDLEVYVDLAVTVGAGGTAPTKSPFAPWNIFSEIQLSLGGGPFQRVSPYFYYLREKAMHPGWEPGQTDVSNAPSYVQSTAWSVPSVTAPAGSTTDNYWKFSIRVPLQVAYGSIMGHIPLGNAATTAKLRLTVANNLIGSDQFASPMTGGTNATAAIGTAQTSYVQPNINYRTSPATGGQFPTPQIGMVLNVQQRATSFVGAGALTPVKFPDPFRYLRLWHVIVDGTGAPNSTNVSNFELDLTPGYPQYNYANHTQMSNYFQKVNRLYRQNLPTGVFVFDLTSGNNPENPNGTQIIDGAKFATLQTQVGVDAATNVSSPAKIITFAEALSPVQF